MIAWNKNIFLLRIAEHFLSTCHMPLYIMMARIQFQNAMNLTKRIKTLENRTKNGEKRLFLCLFFYIGALPSPVQLIAPGYLSWEIICIKDTTRQEFPLCFWGNSAGCLEEIFKIRLCCYVPHTYSFFDSLGLSKWCNIGVSEGYFLAKYKKITKFISYGVYFANVSTFFTFMHTHFCAVENKARFKVHYEISCYVASKIK